MARIARGDEFVDSALEVIANAVTVEQMRQALAVVLPLRFGMTLEQTAQIAGVSVGWASRLRNRFILGKPVGDGSVPARGGAQAPELHIRAGGRLAQTIFAASQ